ncbi:MAG: nucleotidyltransferase domain-containing protein [bacterium]|nr:nucleotidyltransferase domain-containing protein [bacterium]
MALVNPVIEQRATRALQVLARHMKVRAGFLFGSHVDGTPDAYSDIDLAVFAEGIEAWNIFERADMTALVQREVGDDIELHYFPVHTLESCDPASFAAYVLCRGVQINGTALNS